MDGGAEGSVARGDSTNTPKRTSPMVFYRQVVAELRKVVWPTREQLVTYFIVVLVFVTVMMTFVATLDLVFGKVVLDLFSGNEGQ